MADCQEQERAFDHALDDFANSIYSAALADRLEKDAESAAIATTFAGTVARHLDPPNQHLVDRLDQGYRSSLDAIQMTQQMQGIAKDMVKQSQENFEKALGELCHCWESQEKQEVGPRLSADEGDDGDDDDEDDFDELEEDVEELMEEIDTILEEAAAAFGDALDEDGEGEDADVALVS